ncbi:hypothetical protein CCUS01_00235, partial [Colletotrichum cuscutae]
FVVVVVFFLFYPLRFPHALFLHSYPCPPWLALAPLPYHDSPVAKSLAFAGGCDC